MSLFRRTVLAPPQITQALEADEVVLGLARDDAGAELAVTRRRLLLSRHEATPTSLSWFEIARARLDDGVLEIVPLHWVATFADGAGDVVVDAPTLALRIGRANRLTDQIHQRVRSSVIASQHLPWPGAGGWVTICRVAGVDGVLPQLRLDAGADRAVPGFLSAAERVVIGLRAGGPGSGTTGVDE